MQVCSGSGIRIPTGVIPVPKTYTIDFESSPEEDADPMQTGLHVGLDDDNFSDFVVGDGSGFIATMDNYTFAGTARPYSIALSTPWELCVAYCADMLHVWS